MRKRVLIVKDSDEYLNLGLLIPEAMTDIDAKELVGDAIDAAKEADPDEWTYDDVIKVLATSAPTLELIEIVELFE